MARPDLSPDPRPILIAGPTASGKSGLALRLAERAPSVVINADALQVYDGWRVLTARPSAEEEAQAPHRLYGHVPVQETHSAGRWLREVAAELEAARAAGLRPIVVGGTGLYFTALTQGLAEIPETPPEVRAAAEARLAELGAEGFAAELARLDPATHARIDLRNPRRVMRAWEAFHVAGRPLSEMQDATPPPLLPLAHARPLRLMPERERLYARIEARFDQMLAEGALEEARAALDWPSPSPAAMKAIGAAELTAHLRGEISLAEAREAAVQATRRYAKRQLTWMRNRLGDWPAAEDPDEGLRLLG
ncbi:tRNA (adenosine(37)-N6)-dimethylallyltransferase MiaA [Albimonas sp. CAU 1670]|uniref:tRNA (adenosine(37)-N6)-dimethylallyltransferase MiaA n=1 Tax=Albimonas sp. CAU 1670 TaxID=3032599 RepID=UPI0023DB61E8|nr:tRNA (adenosine(37)-N6)-dimethylallyltransferase MiaA [Albimonas sp. CAU 1670]MDF2235479.1 tRNA (adenosine(37)-N6)-dimethylallyltransferase MiaA [Albimonas sp. CAU 1670]